MKQFLAAFLIAVSLLLSQPMAYSQVDPRFNVITDERYDMLRLLLLGSEGVLTQRWGNKAPVNATSCNADPSLNQLHVGVDFGASLGTPVFSASSGEVIRIAPGDPADQSVLSTLVIFDAVTQTSYIYLHMDTFDPALRVGGQVALGQRLGTVGARGRVTGPHLHFESRGMGSAPFFGIKEAGALCIDGTVNPFEAVINSGNLSP